MARQSFRLFVAAVGSLLAMASCAGETNPEADNDEERTGEAAQDVCACYPLPGFSSLIYTQGLQVYQRNNADFLTVVDLRYATLRNITGPVSGSSVGLLDESGFWWAAKGLESTTRKLRVVVNGTFFSQSGNSVPIAYGLKKDSSLISWGYARPDTSPDSFGKQGLVQLFAFNNSAQRAWIGAWNTGSLSTSPDVIGALSPSASKDNINLNYCLTTTSRTFAGLMDQNCDGTPETVLLYTSKCSSRDDANKVLTGFGALATTMLDGGTSTFMVYDGKIPIQQAKGGLPHAIAVFTGK